ncbi:MAG TPA: sodium:proton antiporter, partial [Burkholderiaceae bacterium]|nr:sodium:proton antiporter [Burkholderiaceae bacterium]
MRPSLVVRPILMLVLLAAPIASHAEAMDGSRLSAWWAMPFAGMLLGIALLPLLAPMLWHAHYGKIAIGWAMAFVLPFALQNGASAALHVVAHALIAEYLPFIILLVALFAVAGGIYIRGNLHGSPGTNVRLIAVGAALASVMGTTGASMLMIRPLIRANDHRRTATHVIIFFIFIVSNAAGALTPLGDPPLFLGFLQGVDFFWTARHLFGQTLFLCGALLAIFYAIDHWHYRGEEVRKPDPTPDTPSYGIDGKVNLLLLAVSVTAVLASGLWKPGIAFKVMGMQIGLPGLLRDAVLLGVAIVSMAVTPAKVRLDNEFSWAPMQEVAKLFLGIFITMAPVLAMLKAGTAGAFAPVALAVTASNGDPQPWAYFWFSGVLSSFLDNAPTYLVFFNLAGGNPDQLMTTLASTLAAVSCGSVFMGANSYIGNAPNFMVKAIAEHRGIGMPSFFGYML